MNDPLIEMIPVEDLSGYEKNSRTHSDEQVKQIAASIKEFGFNNPVLIDSKHGIIAGHGRWMAAKSLGIPCVPCIRLSHLTAEQKRAYIIADNKLADNAGWDMDVLRFEIGELAALDFDLGILGFEDKALDEMLAHIDGTQGLTDEDDVPDAPEVPVTQAGDVWELGRHRIICGSSTEAQTVSRLLGEIRPHLMVMDPPYGVKYDASWRRNINPSAKLAEGVVLNDDIADWSEAWALFPGDVAYIWHGFIHTHVVAESLIKCGFEIRSQIIWQKNHFVIGRGHYHPHHEPCWYVVRKTAANGHWNGDRKQSTIWSINKPLKSDTGHSTQKPVECMRRPILNNSSPGQAVYEPFSGSGTTIIAAEETGRVCYAVELNPAYVDMAVLRWEKFTGQKAKLFKT